LRAACPPELRYRMRAYHYYYNNDLNKRLMRGDPGRTPLNFSILNKPRISRLFNLRSTTAVLSAATLDAPQVFPNKLSLLPRSSRAQANFHFQEKFGAVPCWRPSRFHYNCVPVCVMVDAAGGGAGRRPPGGGGGGGAGGGGGRGGGAPPPREGEKHNEGGPVEPENLRMGGRA